MKRKMTKTPKMTIQIWEGTVYPSLSSVLVSDLDHNSLYEGRWIVGSNDPDADTDQFDDDGYNVQSRSGGNEM